MSASLESKPRTSKAEPRSSVEVHQPRRENFGDSREGDHLLGYLFLASVVLAEVGWIAALTYVATRYL